MRMMIRSRGAIALGVLFAAGTLTVLLSNVQTVADLSIDHMMSVLVLVGTIASGHLWWREVRSGRVLDACGLACLFLAGTMYLVTASAARNADAQLGHAAEIRKASEERAVVVRDLELARADLRRAADAAGRECASGNGTKCDGLSRVRDAAQSHVLLLEASAARLKARPEPNAGLRHAAAVFSTLPWVTSTEAVIFDRLVLWAPFVKALFLELATLVFVSVGLGWRAQAEQEVRQARRTAPRETTVGDPWSREAAEAYLVTHLALGRDIPSQDDLAERWGVHKGTVSKWLKAWESEGLISREAIGRRKVTTAA